MSFVEEARKRVQEIMERIKARRPFVQGSMLRGSEGQVIGGLIGGGKIIENISKTIDNVVSMAKERRPNIIPTVLERIKAYEPGKRIKEIVPLTTGETSTTPSTETKKILRE